MDEEGSYVFSFKEMNYSIDDYKMFMRKTGLFNLLENHILGNLVDYVTGVETGLDSNGRKNRGGKAFELSGKYRMGIEGAFELNNKTKTNVNNRTHLRFFIFCLLIFSWIYPFYIGNDSTR